eukprot:Colp12_sorted_trinity150504_noHs@23813
MDSQNGTGGGHGGQSRRKDNIAPLSIDTTLIKAVPLTDQNDALKDLKLLGISVYDQSEFEAGVIAQVDEAIHTQQLAEVQAELNTLQTELRTLKASNVEVSAKLAKLASSIFPSNEQQKEMERLGKQKERQLRRLKDLMLQEKAALQQLDRLSPMQSSAQKPGKEKHAENSGSVRVYAHTVTHTHTHTHTRGHTHNTHTCTHAHIFLQKQTHIHTCTHIHTHAHMH